MVIQGDAPPGGWAARFLGISLYLKLVVAATLLLGGAVAAGALVAHAAPPPHVRGWLALGVLAVAGANALLVHLALLPLRSVESVVRDVESGDLSCRVPVSRLADRDMVRVVGVVNRMLDALEAVQVRERILANRLAEGDERERKQLSAELLDGTAQLLSSILIQLQLARRGLAEPTPQRLPAIRKALEEARKGTALALDEVGRIARGLRPPEFDELGPLRALEAWARRLMVHEGAELVVEGDGMPTDLPPELALAFFRIFQEALSLAVTQGRARHLTLRSTWTRQEFQAELLDDGSGLAAEAEEGPTSAQLGLLRMQEHARRVGGRLKITTTPEQGTLLRLELPR